MSNKKYIPVFLAALLFIGFLTRGYFSVDQNHASLDPLQQDMQFAWPAVGQAAIGSVEDGVLASSPGSEKMRPIASMTKVITALAIMEKSPFKPGQEGQSYIITGNDIAGLRAYIAEGGSALPVLIGTRMTQYQAMQRMLIASDNNTADILVERVFGSKRSYIVYARNMLKRMGLTRTIVVDASGFSPATVSVPSELIAIGIAALKNPVIAGIVVRQQVQIPVAGIIKNTNQLLGINGTVGIKTGTTSRAGSCLLFAAGYAAKDGKRGTIVGVIMGDINHGRLYTDSRNLLASAKQYFSRVDVQPMGKARVSLTKQESRSLSPNQ